MKFSRRHFMLQAAGVSALAATGTLPGTITRAFAEAKQEALPWHNWSGGQSCTPERRAAPASTEELASLLKTGPAPLRAVGAGHSFSPIVPTPGTIFSLDRMSGVIGSDPSTDEAAVMGGTRLGALGASLAERGLALNNMPDINKQTIAGAISTSTHGSGANIGSLSTFVSGLRLMTADGETIDCDADNNADLFQAARVSIGALGVITQVKLKARPLYKLKRRTWVMPIDDMLEEAPKLWRENHIFEFYYIPFSGMALGISNNITDEPETPVPPQTDDDSLEELKMLEEWLGWAPSARRWILQKLLGDIEPEERVDYSHKTLSTERGVRFNEMEDNNLEVFFPIEFRTVAADDIWLSPFHERESASIAVHRYYKEDYKPYFAAIEPIHRAAGGRPHWGKLNTLTGADFAKLYPRWEDFKRIRNELDPKGRLLNDYLKGLFA
jgi:FAD-linked oxidoreductase